MRPQAVSRMPKRLSQPRFYDWIYENAFRSQFLSKQIHPLCSTREGVEKLREKVSLGGLPGIDFQVDIHLGAVIKLAHRFGVALAAVILGVDLVVDGSG
jgi:hypothetical protein